ncbi:MAG TPA: hypothetical protein VGO08_20965 [Burkholderiales bacterium]|nr:hypothetical protein [Burkholderiales bacterium]
MAEQGDPDLSLDDYKLLNHLYEIGNQESEVEKRLAERLISLGLVFKDDNGHLRISYRGTELLRAYQGYVMRQSR